MNGIYSDQRAEQLHKEFPNCHTVILVNDDTCTCCQSTMVYHFTPESRPEKQKQKQKQGKNLNQRKNLERMVKTKRVDNFHNIGKTKRNSH